jgi:hypothetical protein
VLLPVAEPPYEFADAAPTPQAVEVQVAYVYLFLVVEATVVYPKANIPTVPSPPALAAL